MSILDEAVKRIDSDGNRKVDIETIVKEIFSSVDPDLKTDLTPLQIIHVARAKAFAKQYKSDVMETVIIYLLRLRYSKSRHSRKEVVEALQSVLMRDDDRLNKDMRAKLLGA